MRLGDLTWQDLVGASPLLVLPLGATEQHGPHLPIDTDTVIVDALVTATTNGHADRVAAPTLPYGSSGEHAGFPGTLSLGQAALESAVVELVRSADAFRCVAVVCWHGGNGEAVARAVRLLDGEGRNVRVWAGTHLGADLHAGRTETALMLHLAPGSVREQRAAGTVAPLSEIKGRLRAEGVRAVSPNGVLGDPEGATAAEGSAIFTRLAESLDRFLSDAP